jgi:hypothetical protein
MRIPSLLIVSRNFLQPLTLAANLGGMVMRATRLLAVCCLVSDPTNKTMPPFHSLLRAMWGLDIITIVAKGSVVQTACIAKKSAKQSCWYKNVLRPGITCDLTHELSTTDWYGKFWSWSRMPLLKIEELPDIFISRGYLKSARSLMR